MVILKNISRILSPELLSVLARMGHGNEIGSMSFKNKHTCCMCKMRLDSFFFPCSVFADANFPSASICKHGPELVRADGTVMPSFLLLQ